MVLFLTLFNHLHLERTGHQGLFQLANVRA
jgi:hypothetical protein